MLKPKECTLVMVIIMQPLTIPSPDASKSSATICAWLHDHVDLHWLSAAIQKALQQCIDLIITSNLYASAIA